MINTLGIITMALAPFLAIKVHYSLLNKVVYPKHPAEITEFPSFPMNKGDTIVLSWKPLEKEFSIRNMT